MINLLIGLLPAIIWGIMPVLLSITKGNPYIQLLGTTIGSFVFSSLLMLILHPNFSLLGLGFGFLSGLCWSIGQFGQYYGYKTIGVSQVFTLSTSFQIVGNSLIAGLLLKEWNSTFAISKGIIAVIIIVIGIIFTSIKFNGKISSDKKAYLILLFTTVGYWGYSLLPKFENGSAVNIFFVQTIGMLVSALILSSVYLKKNIFKYKISLAKNCIPGLLFGSAAYIYLCSIQLNGIVKAFILSQVSVIIATLFGLYYFKDQKEGISIFRTYCGLVLILIGTVMIEF